MRFDNGRSSLPLDKMRGVEMALRDGKTHVARETASHRLTARLYHYTDSPSKLEFAVEFKDADEMNTPRWTICREPDAVIEGLLDLLFNVEPKGV